MRRAAAILRRRQVPVRELDEGDARIRLPDVLLRRGDHQHGPRHMEARLLEGQQPLAEPVRDGVLRARRAAGRRRHAPPLGVHRVQRRLTDAPGEPGEHEHGERAAVPRHVYERELRL